MQIGPGTRVGPYEILSTLGAGGMGEVYRARDVRLDRQVAIKVLPDLFAADPERLVRFEREARTLAALNHPNIAHLHGIEESGAGRALIMELVEGETLAERISRGAIPLDEALPITRQIADALEAAHDAGIVHRDLKPANIKVRPDGTVKVLDFGLAKVMDPLDPGSKDLANSPTFTSPVMTRMGVILGTAAYMSPEQARGLPADSRADIWAFGVVLYEMLTGKPLFPGAGVSEVIAAVLRDAPKWESLPPETPASVRTLLRRCLQKDPHARIRHAGDVRIELTDLDPRAVDVPRAAPPRRRSRWLAYAIAAAVVVSVPAIVLLNLPRAEAPLRKWIIPQESGETFFERENAPAISPDGQRVAYTDGERLRIQELSSLESRTIPGTGIAGMPTWSPDGSAVAFFLDHKSLWTAPAAGGNPTKLADLPPGLVFGIAWLPNGTLVVNIAWGPRAGDLFVVPERGGRAERFLPPTAEGTPALFYVRGLPDGSVTYARVTGTTGETVLRRPDGSEKVIQIRGRHSGLTYAASGHLLYTHRDAPGVFAQPFDLSQGTTIGEPFRVAENGVAPSASNEGTLVYGRNVPGLRQLTWFDRDGTMRTGVGQPQENIVAPAMSPDGTRVAVSGYEGGRANIWVHDIARGTKGPATFIEAASDPSWHPTDGRIVYQTGNWDLMAVRRDGGQPETLVATSDPEYRGAWSRDGKYFVFGRFTEKTLGDIMVIEQGKAEPRPLIATTINEMAPAMSPDGRYIAYTSDESGEETVFVREFPGGGGKTQVSNGGGKFPRWSPKGNEIFFMRGHTLMSVAVRAGSSFSSDEPKALFTLEERAGSYDSYATMDGERFVVVRTLKAPRNGIAIVQNWLSEFRK